MSFTRRFNFFPGNDVLTQIEAINIIDLDPPSSIAAVGQGVVCLVGEFADMTYACKVAVSGGVVTISTNPTPVEIFSGQDLLNKLGGFDETIGEFGGDLGNGFVELRNKKFKRLIVCPVNLASSKGMRLYRELPTNKGPTDPTPTVPISPAVVEAGREFKTGANRVRVGGRTTFLGLNDYAHGTDGGGTNGATAQANDFSAASGDFVARGVKKGDILVVGVIGTSLGSNARTYRVQAVTDASTLRVERLDGAVWTWSTESNMPWRLHDGTAADSGPLNQFSEEAGYTVPARPLDTTIAAGTLLSPTVAPPAPTATACDPLGGLGAIATAAAAGLVYTAAVQAPNAPNHASLDVLYSSALDALKQDAEPASEVDIVWCARKINSSVNGNHNALKQNALDASSAGKGRCNIVSPSIDVVSLTTVMSDAEPGVGGASGLIRDERLFYAWPGVITLVKEAVGFNLTGADGSTFNDGIVDQSADGWLASVLSVLPPERNPGQKAEPVPTLLAPILGFQRNAPNLGINEYIALRAKGIVALRIKNGICFQSGITTSLTAKKKNINRRRFADFIEDSVARGLEPFSKLPLTPDLMDAATGEVNAFLKLLLSPNDPTKQRILDYDVDDKSGNTPEGIAEGIYVIIGTVQSIPTADFIVFQARVSPDAIEVRAS